MDPLKVGEPKVITETAASTEVTSTHITEKKPAAEFREEVTGELKDTNHITFLARSDAVWNKIIERKPELKEKINAFNEKHKDKMQTMQNKSWKELKSELGNQMAQGDDSWENFRKEANALVNELLAEALTEMDLPQVTWTACGTVGYNSDVDTSMLGRLTLDQAYTIKCLRDTTHAFVFRGLSGTQLDTECYTPHPAKDNTASQLTTTLCKSQFATSECSMALLQGKVGLQHQPEVWRKFCQEEVNNSGDRRETTRATINTIDNWHDAMHFDTLKEIIIENEHLSREAVNGMGKEEIFERAEKITANDKEAYKRAALNYRAPIMLQLSSQCNRLNNQLSGLRNQQQQYEKTLIEMDTLSKMLNSLQDEGTFSQAEGNVTLFAEGGQQDASAKAQVPKLIKRSESVAHINVIREEARAKIPQKKPPTVRELTHAAYEEQQQFKHVMQDGLQRAAEMQEPEKAAAQAGKTAIAAGKYCLRTIRNKRRAMESVEKLYKHENKKLPEGFSDLLARMKNMEDKALHLEQCKRRNVLNKESALVLLKKALPEADPKKLEEIVDRHQQTLSDETLLKREKLNILVKDLTEHIGEIDTIRPTKAPHLGDKLLPRQETVRNVLQGMVGYSQVKEKHTGLAPLFDDAEKITLETFDLTTLEKVKEFEQEVEQLSRDWQNMAFEMKVLDSLTGPEWVNENMNYNEIWQSAKHDALERRVT